MLEALRLDPDLNVRKAASRGGPSLGPNALDSLSEAVAHENMGVRLAAIRGIGDVG